MELSFPCFLFFLFHITTAKTARLTFFQYVDACGSEWPAVGCFSPYLLNPLRLQKVWGSGRYGRCCLIFPSVCWPTHSCSVLAGSWGTPVTKQKICVGKLRDQGKNREKAERIWEQYSLYWMNISVSGKSELHTYLGEWHGYSCLSCTWTVKPHFHPT